MQRSSTLDAWGEEAQRYSVLVCKYGNEGGDQVLDSALHDDASLDLRPLWEWYVRCVDESMAAEASGRGAESSHSIALQGFVFERVLNEDARTRTASLLGHYSTDNGNQAAVINIEKTHFTPSFYEQLGPQLSSSTARQGSLASTTAIGANDVYTWILGWMPAAREEQTSEEKGAPDAHVKLTIIRPATEAHILKYSEQAKVMVRETPDMFEHVIEPYISSQAPERIQWVYNILEKKKEKDAILFEDPDPQRGFVMVPDLKWDRRTLSSLYLVAIVHDRSLRSMRDLTPQHLPLLRNVARQASLVAREKFGLGAAEASAASHGKVRCFVHYQPTYYHLHIHILSSDYTSHPGAIVGQAHLLDDVIDMLEMGVDMRKRTLTYALGERSPLLPLIAAYETKRNKATGKDGSDGVHS